jgi:transcriptional regulator with XRE-family HTH domain
MNGLDIKNLRLKLGVTQRELAEMVGVSEKTVQNWEYGKPIPTTKHQILRTIQSGVEENVSTEDINQRIRKVLKDKDLSVAAFSREAGIEQTTLNRQLNGGSKVSVGTIKAFLLKFKDISAEWLLRGVGDMCCGVPDEQLEREIAEETGRVQSIGDNSNHNTQTMTDSAIAKENEMLRKSIEEKNEEIKFLRSLIQRNAD